MKKDDLKAVVIIAAIYLLMESLGVTCPIKYVTGISCAGCGMSRAWFSLLSLDIKGAFHYHPLFWLVPIVAAVYLLKERISDKMYKTLMYGAVCAMLACYIVRMADPNDDIVVFEITRGLIGKLFFR